MHLLHSWAGICSKCLELSTADPPSKTAKDARRMVYVSQIRERFLMHSPLQKTYT